MGNIGGQASGDFLLSQGALRILYSLIKDTIASLAADGFTQSNPNVVTTASARSTTLPTSVKKGVLGGSVAFTRPDIGQHTAGGAVLVAAAFVAGTRPLGFFINDSLGNSFENTPGVASGKGPYVRGGTLGVKIYETQVQTTNLYSGGTWATSGATVGTALTYSPGDRLYASVNGLLTNRWEDSYEAQWIATATTGAGASGSPRASDITLMGTVLSPPDSSSAELFFQATPL
ncbi:MAG TPA: hypothetical protein VIE65_17340 [Methylobacter sp.]|jgi:hypothetical protein